jgi:hypothetical protein
LVAAATCCAIATAWRQCRWRRRSQTCDRLCNRCCLYQVMSQAALTTRPSAARNSVFAPAAALCVVVHECEVHACVCACTYVLVWVVFVVCVVCLCVWGCVA